MESDPIGLRGGLNTYAYSESAPTRYYDADGRQAQAAGLCATPIGMIACGGAAAGAAIMMSTPSGRQKLKSIAKKIEDMCTPDEDDPCEHQFQDDEKNCYDNHSAFGYAHFSFQGCMQNARIRYQQCKAGHDPMDRWGDGHVTGEPPIPSRGKR